MNDEEIKQLAEKVATGNASKKEALQFLQELNSLLNQLKKELKNN